MVRHCTFRGHHNTRGTLFAIFCIKPAKCFITEDLHLSHIPGRNPIEGN